MKTLVKIYSLLSLSESDVRRVLPEAVVVSPIERGQLASDVADGVHVIGLVDGVFHQSLAVAPGEILDAMRAGIKVFGASSMGALRAAELAPYGMIGVGEIASHIAQRRYFRDDFLAQAFSPDLKNIVALPFIDFYFNVNRLVARGQLTAGRGCALLRVYQELHYLDRNSATMRERLRGKFPARDPIHAAAGRAIGAIGSQKKRDGLAMCERSAASWSGSPGSTRRSPVPGRPGCSGCSRRDRWPRFHQASRRGSAGSRAWWRSSAATG